MAKKTKIDKENTTDKDDLSALINRTDQENPNPEDLKRIRAILDQDNTLVRINECSQRAFDRVVASFTSSELVKEL